MLHRSQILKARSLATAQSTKRICSPKTLLCTSLLLFGAGLSTPVATEEYVARSGVFLEPGPTPECDDFADQLESVADKVVDGVEYLGEKTLNTVVALGTLLVEGDPDALLDEVNSTFEDAAAAAASLSKYTPLALISVVVDALPDGAVTSFLEDGVRFQDDLREGVFSGVVSGLNPITVADTLINDLEEIGGDLGKVLVNLDDPLSAGNEFLKLNQKWTGAGALTYMFTEGDPVKGMKKALQAMHRQVELVANYAGPNGKVASATLGYAMEESKKYIDSLPEGETKTAAALFAATFAVTYKKTLADPNFDPETSFDRHPIYQAERRKVNTVWYGDDHDTGGTYDWGLIHPVVEDKPGCINLGDYAYPNRSASKEFYAICGVESGRDDWWTRPIDYKVVWGDNCSGGTHDRSIWAPVCPEDYVSVGFAVGRGTSTKPLPNQVACLKNDINILTVTDGYSAGLQFIANDEDSGAKFDVTVYNRKFMGMEMLHAVNVQKGKSDLDFVASLKIPVEVPGIEPAYASGHCANFYAEPNFYGYTLQVCGNDATYALNGITGQLKAEGMSSFQCGDEIAAVELFDANGYSKLFNCGYAPAALGDWDSRAVTARLYSSVIDPIYGNLVESRRTIEERNAIENQYKPDPVAIDASIVSTDIAQLGSGTVSFSPEPDPDTGGYLPDDIVTLTAAPTARSEFVNWGGDAAQCGSAFSCDITIVEDQAVSVSATFQPKPTLFYSAQGNGSVSVDVSGASCGYGGACNIYSSGQQVGLQYQAGEGSAFVKWRGDGDCLDGVVTLTENLSCYALFQRTTYDLTIEPVEGVRVVSEPSGLIDCENGGDCSETFQASDGAEIVELEASVSEGYTFVRWTGLYDCYDEDENDNDPLTIRVEVGEKDVSCTANVVPEGTEYSLAIEKVGGGIVKIGRAHV